ncbi:MAG: zf-HC2 domain-containing protein [Acidobacteria bacterium]|nr:zf-HC2 domain-containing protein [Acidobacteriota bacterium]
MNWKCEQIEERLSEHLDGLLDATESAAFESHVAGCAQCRALVAQVNGALEQVHRLEMLEEPLGLTTAILDRTLGPRAPKKNWKAFAWLQPVLQPRMAMGLATVARFGWVSLQAMGVQLSAIKLSDLSPVKLYQASTRQAHLIYARGEKFVSDLRVVYEIQSRLRPAQEEPPATPQQQPPPKANPQDKPSRESNWLNDPACRLCVVTTGLSSVPGRSMR